MASNQTNSIQIGITDCARYTNYERWILDSPVQPEVIRLSYNLENIDDIKRCNGVILTGGEDIHPRFYHRNDLLEKLDLTSIDEKRDDFEWNVIQRAFMLKLPILGICRGMQLMNVYMNGTLIYDIPEVTQIQVHAKVNGIDQRHDITVESNTYLNRITGCLQGPVNSSHHQCIDKLGQNILVSARAEEPIIEAVEWQNLADHPFYIGVQWHPERMPDQDNPFSHNIREGFLQEVIRNRNQSNQ